VAALSIGFLAGRMDTIFGHGDGKGPGPRRPGSTAEAGDVKPGKARRAPEEPAAGEEGPEKTAPSGTSEVKVAAPDDTASAEAAGEAQRIADDLLVAVAKPPAGPEEAERILFRLFLDVLGRPPTRAEVSALSPLDHFARWKRIAAISEETDVGGGALSRIRGEGLARTFRRFLGREPSATEEKAFLLAAGRLSAEGGKGDGVGDGVRLGLLASGTEEYRNPAFRRHRSPAQRAASFIVDFFDRPPSSPGELEEVEKVLSTYPKGTSLARILAFSSEGSASASRTGAGSSDPGEWTRREVRRFAGRNPTEAELAAAVAEVRAAGPSEGTRRLRMALAGLEEYRSY